MSELKREFNKLFPDVLLAYVQDRECVLSNSDCNELSKWAEHLEAENDRLRKALHKIAQTKITLGTADTTAFAIRKIAKEALEVKE